MSRWKECAPGLLCPYCLGCKVLPQRSAFAVESSEAPKPFTKEEKERVLKQIAHLHRSTGHGSYESLLKSLQARKADPRVVEVAQGYRCPTCEERKRPAPRKLANWEVQTEKGKVVQFDTAWWSPRGTRGTSASSLF